MISKGSIDASYKLGISNLVYNLTVGERVEFIGSQVSFSGFYRVFPYAVVCMNGISFPAKATYKSVGGCDAFNILIDNVALIEVEEVGENVDDISVRLYLTLL